jgi:hypothetical protein
VFLGPAGGCGACRVVGAVLLDRPSELCWTSKMGSRERTRRGADHRLVDFFALFSADISV